MYELKDGKGLIVEYENFEDELFFEGEYENGKKNGEGILFNGYGIKFEGEFLNGKKWNGKGYDEDGNIIYEIKDGKGILKEYNGDNVLIYEGEYLNGELIG